MKRFYTKGAVGAAIAVAIELASNSRYYFIAGLLPLFPAFAILAHYSVSVNRTREDLRQTILFTILSLIPYLTYLVSLYFLVGRTNIVKSILISSILWLFCAGVLVAVWRCVTPCFR